MVSTSTERPFRIVVALDHSEYSEIVLEHALDQAARHTTPDLHFLLVVRDPRADLEEAKRWLAGEALEGLDVFRKGSPDWSARLHVRFGKPYEEIANLAAEIDADLIVIGRFGAHRGRRSIADRLIERAPCPTLVIGLSGHTVEANPQCPACVEVRAASDGELWFCAEHTKSDSFGLTERLPLSTSLIHGGPLL
jgi:nucleotide-binding universal stress UspA family protein